MVGLLDVEDHHPGEQGIASGRKAGERGGVVGRRVASRLRLLSGPGLPGDGEAVHARGAAGSILDDPDQQLAHPGRRHRGHDPVAGCERLRLPSDPADQTQGQADAARRDRVDALDELGGSYGDPLAEGHGRQPDRSPDTSAGHDSATLPAERQPRRFSESEGVQICVEGFGAEARSNLKGADVGGALDHAGKGQRPERLPVADDPPADAVAAPERVELLFLIRHSLLEGGGGGEDLEDRSGLVRIGDRPIGERRRGIFLCLVRVEGRSAGHRQHLAGLGLNQNDGARSCRKLGNGPLEFFLGNSLQVGIDRQFDVGPRARLPHHAASPARPPAVGPDGAASGLSSQHPVKGELDAPQAIAVRPHETQNVGGEFGAGIEAAVFLDGPHRETGFAGARDLRRRGLALEPGEPGGAPQSSLDQGARYLETR